MQRHDVLWISWNIIVFSWLLALRVHKASEDENEYATTLFAGQFNHTRKASMEFFEKGHVLLSSSSTSGKFFFSMISCKLAIAHNGTTSSHTVVWSLPFPHCQMGNQYTLSFLRDGNFIVSMAQKTFAEDSTSQLEGQIEVWATNTQGQNVKTIELGDNGNLVLYNSKKEPIWQSFNHPSSTLLSSQVLKQGMALTLYEDLFRYSLVVEPYRAVFYMIDNITQDHKPYWELLPNCSRNASIAFAAIDEEGNFQLYDIAFNPLVIYENTRDGQKSHYFNPEIARFGGELWRAEVTSTVIGVGGSIVKYGGNLEVYHWCSRDGAWRQRSRAIKRRCQFPSACPRYEACEGEEGQCRCMVGLEGGCIRRGLPLKLAGAAKHAGCEEAEFVEVKNMSYFAVEVGGESVLQVATFAECRNACRRNCSCAAFVYRQDSVRSCYPVHEHEPLLNPRLSSLTFLAVANPLSTVYMRAHFLPSSISSTTCTPKLVYYLLGLLLVLIS